MALPRALKGTLVVVVSLVVVAGLVLGLRSLTTEQAEELNTVLANNLDVLDRDLATMRSGRDSMVRERAAKAAFKTLAKFELVFGGEAPKGARAVVFLREPPSAAEEAAEEELEARRHSKGMPRPAPATR